MKKTMSSILIGGIILASGSFSEIVNAAKYNQVQQGWVQQNGKW
ncbi:TPA: hypothetical protein ACSPOR_004596 [Bacillus cereus]|nr:hypothetical protein [Bacillus cereus]